MCGWPKHGQEDKHGGEIESLASRSGKHDRPVARAVNIQEVAILNQATRNVRIR